VRFPCGGGEDLEVERRSAIALISEMFSVRQGALVALQHVVLVPVFPAIPM